MRICSVENCETIHWSKGYCRKHYERVVKHGSTDRYITPKPECKIDNCSNVGSIVGLCKKHYDKERQTNKPLSQEADHANHIKYRYGITIDEYNKKLADQNFVCSICKEPETRLLSGKLKRLAVDHCHTTNAIRDLLCTRCNVFIGSVKENINLLHEMIAYLNRHKGLR